MFWAVHDTLFEHQDALTDRALVGYVKAPDLDTARFGDELRQHQHATRVRENVSGGIRSGVNGTPTFYINGVRHDAPYDLEILLAAASAAARNVREAGGRPSIGRVSGGRGRRSPKG